MAQGDWDDIEVMLEFKMYDSFKYEGGLREHCAEYFS